MFHLAIAAAGITWLTMVIGGELRIRAGLDPFEALNHEGAVAFVFSLSLGYVFRLIFWDRVSQRHQDFVRKFVSLIFCTEIILAAAGVFLRLTQANVQGTHDKSGTIVMTVFLIFGLLCQISTVIWLLRYRRE